MIDRTKIPSFFRNFPEERLREIMEEDIQPNKMGFDDAMDVRAAELALECSRRIQ